MKRLILLLAFATPLFAQRIASDFEIQQMEQQLAKSHDFISQLSGHLNLGDLRATRNEMVIARAEYLKALEVASKERIDARKASELTRYATATSYAALAQAKLGNAGDAFALADEAVRYTSDSSKTWNVYAATMTALRKPAKAASAARNAVALATDNLDLAIYQYALASALLDLNQNAEAERLLVEAVASLRSSKFADLQRAVQQHESFEIYSSARGEESAYISILNRTQLALGGIYEDRGDVERARQQYQNILAARVDEPDALAGMARLARNDPERQRYYVDAFDANPFSVPLIRDYQRYLTGAAPAAASTTTGGQVRRALEQMHANDLTAARNTLDALLQKFPENETLKMLRREVEERRAGAVVLRPNPTAADLRAILTAFQDNRLTPDQRTQLDQMTFTSVAVLNGPTGSVFETGTVESVPFRFSEPTQFQGTFPGNTPLRLTYRILGATRVGDADGLLLEPVKLEVSR